MNDFFQPRELTFALEGLDRDYTFLHISDVHISAPDYAENGDEKARLADSVARWEHDRKYYTDMFGEDFSPAHAIPLNGYFEKYIALANELKPDAVLCTGDLFDFYSDANAAYLQTVMPDLNVPFLWASGNHEVDPMPVYHRYMGDDLDLHAHDFGRLRFIVLNDAKRKITADVAARFKALAEDADHIPVLMTHIPFRTPKNKEGMKIVNSYFAIETGDNDPDTDTFLSYLLSPECPVKLFLCGHVHGFMDTVPADGKRQITASSAMVGGCNILHFVKKDALKGDLT